VKNAIYVCICLTIFQGTQTNLVTFVHNILYLNYCMFEVGMYHESKRCTKLSTAAVCDLYPNVHQADNQKVSRVLEEYVY